MIGQSNSQAQELSTDMLNYIYCMIWVHQNACYNVEAQQRPVLGFLPLWTRQFSLANARYFWTVEATESWLRSNWSILDVDYLACLICYIILKKSGVIVSQRWYLGQLWIHPPPPSIDRREIRIKRKNPSQIFFALFYCIKRPSTGATLKKLERGNVLHIGHLIYSPCLTFCGFSHRTSFSHRFQKTTNYTKSKHCSALGPTFLDSSRHFTSKSPFFNTKIFFYNVFNTKMPFLPLLSTTTMVDLHIAQSRAS